MKLTGKVSSQPDNGHISIVSTLYRIKGVHHRHIPLIRRDSTQLLFSVGMQLEADQMPKSFHSPTSSTSKMGKA